MNRSLIAIIVTLQLASCSSSQASTETTTTSANTSTGGSSMEPASSSPPPTASAEPSASPEPVASASPAPIELPPMPANLHGPTTPWARMNAQARSRYMAQSVLPAMRELLHAYDATHFADVTCATCHGANAREVHFRMPNTLPTLHAPGTEAARTAFTEHPRMFAFMRERMTPVMAQLLGQEPFNPQTRSGFGCYGCHPHE